MNKLGMTNDIYKNNSCDYAKHQWWVHDQYWQFHAYSTDDRWWSKTCQSWFTSRGVFGRQFRGDHNERVGDDVRFSIWVEQAGPPVQVGPTAHGFARQGPELLSLLIMAMSQMTGRWNFAIYASVAWKAGYGPQDRWHFCCFTFIISKSIYNLYFFMQMPSV